MLNLEGIFGVAEADLNPRLRDVESGQNHGPMYIRTHDEEFLNSRRGFKGIRIADRWSYYHSHKSLPGAFTP